MKVSIAPAMAILLGAVTCASNALAGAKEDAVLSGCLKQGTPVNYLACVGAGLTGNEINTCLNDPSKCLGPNNELRKAFCAIGQIGCPKPPEEQKLVHVIPFKAGCIAIWTGNIYWSPDCQNLKGGGSTVDAWKVADPDFRYIQAMVIYHDCVITSFSGGGIYKSCDGMNLSGGGQTVRLYQGVKVSEMIACKEDVLRTMFTTGDCYMDPSGDYPGGGGVSRHCAPTDQCTRP